MKKLLLTLLAVALMATTTLFATSCSTQSGTSSGSSSTESNLPDSGSESVSESVSESTNNATVTLQETATVVEFETVTLTYELVGEGEIVWTSSDEGIATVANGVVTGVKAGTATITATVGSAQATCAVTVTATTYTHELAITPTSLKMPKGQTREAELLLTFNGDELELDVEYTWTNKSQTPASTVSQNGTVATFTGTAIGTDEYEVSATVRGYDVYATITVEVTDNIYGLDVTNENLTATEIGYKANLALGSTETDRLAVGVINVLKDGAVAGEATVAWTSANEEIAVVENGVIIGKKAGMATLTGTVEYEGKTLTLTVEVEVAKELVELEASMTIEVATATEIEIPAAITEKIVKITVSGKTVYDGTQEITEGKAPVSEGSMPVKVADLGDNKPVVIETETKAYTIYANVYTMVIENKEDLDNWQKVAVAEAVRAGESVLYANSNKDYNGIGFYTGYFVLGADIDYNADYDPYIDHNNHYQWGQQSGNTSTQWYDTSAVGFTGIFDGKGHSINGLNAKANNIGTYSMNYGFITTLSGGTIRNLSFVDASISGGTTLLVRAGSGTIENVFVSLKNVSDTNSTSVVFGAMSTANRVVKNVIVDISNCTFEATAKDFATLSRNATGVYENVYVVGALVDEATLWGKEPQGSATGSVVNGYDYSEILNSEDEGIKTGVAALDRTFWKVDKAILPINVYEANVVDPVFNLANEDKYIVNGASIILTAKSLGVTYALKDAVEGVAMQGPYLKIDESVAIGTQITVVATSLNGKTAEFTFEVNKAYDLGTEIDLTAENATTNNETGVVPGLHGAKTTVINEGEADYIEGGTGAELKFYKEEQNVAGSFTLANGITVKDGFNYVKLRVYVKSTYDEVPLHFWNITKEPTGYTDGCTVKTVVANAWANVYLNVADFVAGGKFTGLKFGYVGYDLKVDLLASYVCVDYVALVGAKTAVEYNVGTEFEMTKANFEMSNSENPGYVVGFGMWSKILTAADTDEFVEGGNGNIVRFQRNYSDYEGARILFNDPVKVTEDIKFVKLRMFVKSKNETLSENIKIRFYEIGHANHWEGTLTDVNINETTVNQWVEVYIDASKLAVNGQIDGFSFAVYGKGQLVKSVYFDYVSLCAENPNA